MADPSGTRVPRYQARSHPDLLPYSPEQDRQWYSYLGLSCKAMRELMRLPWATLSTGRVTNAQQILVQVTSVQHRSELQPPSIRSLLPSSCPTHDDERSVSHTLTTIMVDSTFDDAMDVITAVVVKWLWQLPEAQMDILRRALQEREPRSTWTEAEVRCFALEWIVISLQDLPG